MIGLELWRARIGRFCHSMCRVKTVTVYQGQGDQVSDEKTDVTVTDVVVLYVVCAFIS